MGLPRPSSSRRAHIAVLIRMLRLVTEQLVDIADELYALLPEEFTAARNDRAKQVRGADRDLAAAVKSLPKPSTAGWLVNMLVRHHAELLDQVLGLGESLRQAQENLAGEELRQLTRQRRQLTAAVTQQGRTLGHELGVRISDAVAGQVEETLRAAMVDADAAKAVRTGRLLEALEATGLGDLDVSRAVAVPEAIGISAKPVTRTTDVPATSERPDLKVVEEPEPDEDEQRARAIEEARAALSAAEEGAGKAGRKLEKSRKRVSKLQATVLQLQGELEELRRRAGELEHQLETVEDDLSAAEDKRDRAERRHEDATDALEQAKAALDDLEG